jgi:hypothetical protein
MMRFLLVGGQITGYHQNKGKVIYYFDFEFMVIYFLEDVLTSWHRTKTTKTLNNRLRRIGHRGCRRR